MKTEEELKTLKEELEAVNKKSAELTDEELTQLAAGGTTIGFGEDNVVPTPNQSQIKSDPEG